MATRPRRDQQVPCLAVLELRGELDVSTAPRVQRALDDIAAAAADVVLVDCGALDFLDLAGARVVASAAAGPARLGLVEVRPVVRRVLALAGLEHLVVDDLPAWLTRALRRTEDALLPVLQELLAQYRADPSEERWHALVDAVSTEPSAAARGRLWDALLSSPVDG